MHVQSTYFHQNEIIHFRVILWNSANLIICGILPRIDSALTFLSSYSGEGAAQVPAPLQPPLSAPFQPQFLESVFALGEDL